MKSAESERNASIVNGREWNASSIQEICAYVDGLFFEWERQQVSYLGSWIDRFCFDFELRVWCEVGRDLIRFWLHEGWSSQMHLTLRSVCDFEDEENEQDFDVRFLTDGYDREISWRATTDRGHGDRGSQRGKLPIVK